jgi:vacuolar protein sorting-associated protein 45
VCPQQLLGQLAKADVNEVIMQVQEVFADYMVVNEEFFHLGIDNSIALSAPNKTGDTKTLMSKNVAGVLSVLLSMKRKPKIIRYTASSPVARELAFSISDTITKEESLFEFRGKQESSMLLVLDRRDVSDISKIEHNNN